MKTTDRDAAASANPNLGRVAFGSPAGLLAFGFGAGLSPFAPGTMGTLVAIPFVFGLKTLDPAAYWLVLMALFLLGVGVCSVVSRRLGVHDHGGIVWDEMVGYWISVAFVPLQWGWLLAAFLLFRLFDIFKPWPIRQLDQKVSGGFGIMLDDVVAALFAVAVLALARLVL
jgi:phosphatidylglycerophosphatase A